MRQIHENVGLYLTLVFISNNFKPNVDLHSTMFILCWDAGIEPSITWKCPPTSVLLQSSLWMTINSVHNLINQKKSIVDCHSIVLSLVEPNFWLGIKPLSFTTVCRPRSYWSGRSESVVRTINSLYIK